MEIKELINLLEELAPPVYSLDWDNSGLQVGTLNKDIDKIAIALTPTKKIIEEAVENDCQLLITHHPLLFKAVKSINIDQPLGKSLQLALKNDLTIYTMHTNFDSSEKGLNYQIAQDLGLDNINVLSVTSNIELLKLVTFVPEEYTLKVINELSEAGAGNIGKLSHSSYIMAGISTFVNEDNGIEDLEITNKEPEDRLEIIVPKTKLEKVINILREVHPYTDIIYDIYKLEDKSHSIGIGTIGEFYTPFSLTEVINMVKRILRVKNLTYVGSPNKQVAKVAICTGSGASFMELAKKKGADLYITGDIKYHTAIDAQELDLALIDAGHYATEIIAVPFLAKYIKKHLADAPEIVELEEDDPFSYS
jgi:dinuclear metal center YbgI/SA1388 family protein